jgi:two-component system, OmpR family, phosphate regulon response regulator PhoB
MANTVLVVEDEPDIRELVCQVDKALHILSTETVDLAIIDWMLPGLSGIDLAKSIRANPRLKQLPMLLLTARGREGDKLEGFAAGVDDFIVKPFSPRELIARVQALLRRSGHEPPAKLLQFQDLLIDPDSQRVSVKPQVLDLSAIQSEC